MFPPLSPINVVPVNETSPCFTKEQLAAADIVPSTATLATVYAWPITDSTESQIGIEDGPFNTLPAIWHTSEVSHSSTHLSSPTNILQQMPPQPYEATVTAPSAWFPTKASFDRRKTLDATFDSALRSPSAVQPTKAEIPTPSALYFPIPTEHSATVSLVHKSTIVSLQPTILRSDESSNNARILPIPRESSDHESTFLAATAFPNLRARFSSKEPSDALSVTLESLLVFPTFNELHQKLSTVANPRHNETSFPYFPLPLTTSTPKAAIIPQVNSQHLGAAPFNSSHLISDTSSTFHSQTQNPTRTAFTLSSLASTAVHAMRSNEYINGILAKTSSDLSAISSSSQRISQSSAATSHQRSTLLSSIELLSEMFINKSTL